MKELDHPNIIFFKCYYYTKAPNQSEDEFFLNLIMDYVPETLSVLYIIIVITIKNFL